MKRALKPLLICALIFALSGCVVSVNESPPKPAVGTVSMKEISRLKFGTSYDAVLDNFGAPMNSTAYQMHGDECRILSYWNHFKVDGEEGSAAIELYFENGKLIGWGNRGRRSDCGSIE